MWGSVSDVLQINAQSYEINHGNNNNNNKNSKTPSNDYFFLFFSSCNALASIRAERCDTRYFVSCLFTSGLSYIHHQMYVRQYGLEELVLSLLFLSNENYFFKA